jgi:hypothetical protein
MNNAGRQKFDLELLSSQRLKEVEGKPDRLCSLVVKISWLQIQRTLARFQALPYFLTNNVSVTGSTQPRENN